MSELIDELKSRLRITDLISATFKVVGNGRERQTQEHDSLKVYAHDDTWRWYSQGIERKQDVLAWLCYQRFNTLAVDGERFIEILKHACQLAGVTYPEKQEYCGKASLKRRKECILDAYVQASERCRTPEFYARAMQRKPYLTEDVCTRWRLGYSPTITQCRESGMTEDDLRLVGILRDSDGGPYMFFRDSIVIPYMEQGRVVYISSRYLSDVDGRGQPRERKTLHLPSPKADGTGGMLRPCGFHLAALYDPAAKLEGILLVEAPLDAVACCERNHPAIAMLGTKPSSELIRRLNVA